ncbi:hypothetical protein L6452_08513 [Arctium lappa]|uniref:Uncharacterized protein n=1 Tax=Arctium lappa TaxID=4217 RepID=A0ACB9DHQ1_ARCLA|nr:hypothetical protein L6452_08513 [Arctium lappa]
MPLLLSWLIAATTVTIIGSHTIKVDKASDAFYKLNNTRSQIHTYLFDVIRASVTKLNLDDDFEQKNDIAKAVEEELYKAMSAYGYLSIVKEEGLEISQPALDTEKSEVHHAITARWSNSIVHRSPGSICSKRRAGAMTYLGHKVQFLVPQILYQEFENIYDCTTKSRELLSLG